MRTNIYNEEITGEVTLVEETIAETGRKFFGLRMFLSSPKLLHKSADRDDRSAVTFWLSEGDKAKARLLQNCLLELAEMVPK